jgi:hypothetical protein
MAAPWISPQNVILNTLISSMYVINMYSSTYTLYVK